MEITGAKPFERPVPGQFLGTIIDIVSMPNYPTVQGLKNKVRIHWILGKTDGTPYLNKENQSFTVVAMPNATLGKKSTLRKLLSQILNTTEIPLVQSDEELARVLIGRSNLLFLSATPNPQDPNNPYINVAGVAPVPPGLMPPSIPQGFVRQKDRQPNQQPGVGQPVPQGYPNPGYAGSGQLPQASHTTVAVPPPTNNLQF